jgi:hypothetical protein
MSQTPAAQSLTPVIPHNSSENPPQNFLDIVDVRQWITQLANRVTPPAIPSNIFTFHRLSCSLLIFRQILAECLRHIPKNVDITRVFRTIRDGRVVFFVKFREWKDAEWFVRAFHGIQTTNGDPITIRIAALEDFRRENEMTDDLNDWWQTDGELSSTAERPANTRPQINFIPQSSSSSLMRRLDVSLSDRLTDAPIETPSSSLSLLNRIEGDNSADATTSEEPRSKRKKRGGKVQKLIRETFGKFATNDPKELNDWTPQVLVIWNSGRGP